MDRHLQRHLQKDIKTIINMQSLLQEYDRENKCLNEQVLLLLNENSQLKMHQIKTNMMHSMLTTTHTSKANKSIINTDFGKVSKEEFIEKMKESAQKDKDKKKNQLESKPTKIEQQGENRIKRKSSSKIIERFRAQRDEKIIETNSIKKDEAVQTTIEEITLQKVIASQDKNKRQSLFSFRLSSEEAKSKLQDTIKIQPSIQLKQSPHKQIIRSSKLLTESDNTMTIKRQKSRNSLGKNHAIQPSPQINQQNMRFFTSHIQSQGNKVHHSHEKIKVNNVQVLQKKKKFIHVVTSYTPPKIIKPNGCC